jgi:uncharacterized protein
MKAALGGIKERPMLDYQERVVAESNDLRTKLDKLSAFISSDVFKKLDMEDRDLLVEQRVFMNSYFETLRQRIERF